MRMSRPVSRSVHPHARGDHFWYATLSTRHPGSPPRPWGPHVVRWRRSCLRRFTPTPVGTTNERSTRPARSAVHPHARGDHPATDERLLEQLGSPPRPWGPRLPENWIEANDRFTPTPVGTTASQEVHQRMVSVHPHARGDHGSASASSTEQPGSPPRPWGPLLGVLQVATDRRFTPTPVGTTTRSGLDRTR